MAEAERRRLARLKPNLERRALIFDLTRSFFRQQGFLEVDTPVRMPEIAPESHIIPFGSEGWYLSTSPELHMKRLITAGYEKIFQFGRCFRKGERGRWHNPEFTMLEWYRVGAGYLEMIRDTEQLIATITRELCGSLKIPYQGHEIDLAPPWPEVTVREAFLRSAGWDPVVRLDPARFDADLVTKVMPAFPSDRPTVPLDYPAALGSLARLKPDNPAVAERAEVFIGGLELANAFSELTDLAEQRKRFKEEVRQIRQMLGQKRAMPQKFLRALRRLPECGGIALGMDRLVMLFCDADSIDQVMPFAMDDI
ncbi:MAG: EF-P lysine aminoacylase GenX [Chloroflexi bacterium]|nr:EF-P lysine aminoacylase GenX [Chloroflexota bacterium]